MSKLDARESYIAAIWLRQRPAAGQRSTPLRLNGRADQPADASCDEHCGGTPERNS